MWNPRRRPIVEPRNVAQVVGRAICEIDKLLGSWAAAVAVSSDERRTATSLKAATLVARVSCAKPTNTAQCVPTLPLPLRKCVWVINASANRSTGRYRRSQHGKLDARQCLSVAHPHILLTACLFTVNWSVEWFACVHRVR